MASEDIEAQTPPVGAPAVSVVIPAFDSSAYLSEALESVRAQDFIDYEVLVVDDGSTDNSVEIAASYDGVRVLRHELNQGAAAAKNTGIQAARGGFIAFLDSDDRWKPGKLGMQYDYLQAHPDLGYAVTLMQNFLEPGHAQPYWLAATALEHTQLGALPSTLMVRREVFDAVGLFDPRYEIAEDNDWLLRCERGGIQRGVLEEVLLERRIHDRNLSHRTPNGISEVPQFIKSFIERKRSLNL